VAQDAVKSYAKSVIQAALAASDLSGKTKRETFLALREEIE
jgi:hypothetical protein